MATGGQKRKRSQRVAALELPPGALNRAWIALRRSHVLWRIGLSLLTSLVLCAVLRGWNPAFTYRSGYSPPHDVVARVPFKMVDFEATDAAAKHAVAQVRYVYELNPEPLLQLAAELRQRVAEVVKAREYADLNPQLWAEFQAPRDRTVSRAAPNPQKRFEAFSAALAGDANLAELGKSLDAALENYLQYGMLERLQHKPGEGDQEEILVHPVGQPEAKKLVKVSDVLIGREGAVLYNKLLRHCGSPDIADPVFDWLLRRRLPTTLSLDKTETDKAVQAALESIPQVVVAYEPGQTLAEASQPLEPDQIAVLRAEYDAYLAQQHPLRQKIFRGGAVVAFVLCLLGLCAFYVQQREPRLTGSMKRIVAMHGLAVLTVVLACWAADDDWRAELVPLLVFAQVVAIAYSRELALLFSGALSMVLVLAIGHSMAALLLMVGVSATAVLQLGRIRSRSKLIHVGVFTGLVAFLLTTGMGILDNQQVGWDLFHHATRNAVCALVAGFIMTGLLPFIEHAFGVLTDISLLELGDVAHPLLQELVRRAPSTYNHSITVGSIAEAAAEAIGARGLLVRVGAYFHDIGKMLKPGYFIENQPPEENRHGSLLPAMSTLVIIAHIKDGADLARQHGLPDPIVDLVQQHHGTTLVEYFYGRATEQSLLDPNGREVDEGAFRYPGPRPQTKEAAVLMLADAAESACRSLVEPGPARIESLVREIAERKLDDGQFDESNLTLRELRMIEDSIIKSLIANYHGRVKYPEQKTV